MPYVEDCSHLARVRAQAFVAALDPAAQALWRRMPRGWTPAMDLRQGEPQSTLSARLAVLRAAHFVEVKQKGRKRLYRPVPKVLFWKEVRRLGHQPRKKRESDSRGPST